MDITNSSENAVLCMVVQWLGVGLDIKRLWAQLSATGQVVHMRASVTKQYNLVLAKVQ